MLWVTHHYSQKMAFISSSNMMLKSSRSLAGMPMSRAVGWRSSSAVASMQTPSTEVRPFSEIPGPRLYPVIGNLYQYTLGPFERFKYHDALKSLNQTYGPLVKENLGGRVIVHVFDPEDIKIVYSNEGKHPVIPPLQETTGIYRAQKKMSLGLGFTNGEEWYRLRSNSQQRMLRPKEVQHHIPAVNRVAQDFTDRLSTVRYNQTNEVSDLATEIGCWSLENAGSRVFDKRLGCFEIGSENEEFAKKMVEANRVIFKYSGILKLAFPFYRYISTPKWRKLVKAEDFMYGNSIRLVDEAILRVRDEIEKGTYDEDRDQFYILSYLLSQLQLNLKDVTVLCLSLFLDALSTTSPTLLFNLYSLATNQRSQDKAYEEIKSIVGTDPTVPITVEHINQMKYLKAFVKETFRVWPNGTEVSRYTDKDFSLQGYHIPSGTHVDLNPFVHFRNPKIFPHPDLHLPERWLRIEDVKQTETPDEGEKVPWRSVIEASEKIHPYLLTPFGHGTRMCAGRRFAEQDLYVLLSTILRKFKLSYAVGEGMDAIYHTLLFPDRPLRIKFENRK